MVTVARNQLKFTRHFRLVNYMENEVIESVDTNRGSLMMFYYFHFFYYLNWFVIWNMFFPCIGNNDPNWLIFFRGVQTTNQSNILLEIDDENPYSAPLWALETKKSSTYGDGSSYSVNHGPKKRGSCSVGIKSSTLWLSINPFTRYN